MTHRILSIAALAAAATLTTGGCTGLGRRVPFGAKMPAKARDCSIRVYGADELPATYTIVGRVEAEHRDRDVATDELKTQACMLGADALVDLQALDLSISRTIFDENREPKLVPDGKLHAAIALAVVLKDPTPVPKTRPAPPVLPASTPLPCTPAEIEPAGDAPDLTPKPATAAAPAATPAPAPAATPAAAPAKAEAPPLDVLPPLDPEPLVP